MVKVLDVRQMNIFFCQIHHLLSRRIEIVFIDNDNLSLKIFFVIKKKINWKKKIQLNSTEETPPTFSQTRCTIFQNIISRHCIMK